MADIAVGQANGQETLQTSLHTEECINDILGTIDREREREIVSRFGLFDRKETLEQIGELLGITRERVRQLEKSVVNRLKAAAEQGNVPRIPEVQSEFLSHLHSLGEVARVSELTEKVGSDISKLQQARVAFLASLCPELVVVNEDDHYYHAVGVKATRDETGVKEAVSKLIDSVKKLGEPASIENIAKAAGFGASKDQIKQAESLASISKHLATLNGRWGLVKWPMVNPKNIRDKIYVILKEQGKHMHFNEIAAAIKDSDFKRRDVTTQAIHNELIKDKRFVLIGRGIYGATKRVLSATSSPTSSKRKAARCTATRSSSVSSRAATSKKRPSCLTCRARHSSSASPRLRTASPSNLNLS
jgi:hypothetical protein